MNIIVLATASRLRGALTIYKQFIGYLKEEIGGDHYYVFVHKSMPQPMIPGVNYIEFDTTSMLDRIKFDFKGCSRMLNIMGVKPDVIVSLQNTGLRTDIPQVIYYHQSIPLYPQNWNFLKKEERYLFYYKYIYPFFVKWTINSCTHFVVQIPFINEGVVRKFQVPSDRVHTMFPDVEEIDVDSINPYLWEDEKKHFIYPANRASYKMHVTLVKALQILNDNNVILHLTLAKGDNPVLDKMISDAGLEETIIREGAIDHSCLLSMYKSATGLLFPSVIETIGLPLLEAAAFGIPIVASDIAYAHQVLEGYEGVEFVVANNVNGWIEAIKRVISTPKMYKSIERKESSWPGFFELVRKVAK